MKIEIDISLIDIERQESVNRLVKSIADQLKETLMSSNPIDYFGCFGQKGTHYDEDGATSTIDNSYSYRVKIIKL